MPAPIMNAFAPRNRLKALALVTGVFTLPTGILCFLFGVILLSTSSMPLGLTMAICLLVVGAGVTLVGLSMCTIGIRGLGLFLDGMEEDINSNIGETIRLIPNNEPTQTNEEKIEQDLQSEQSLESTKTIHENLKKINCNPDILNEDIFLCDIPLDPWTTKYGNTFNHSNLKDLIQKGMSDPQNRQPLRGEDCKPNTPLKKLIDKLNQPYHSPDEIIKAVNTILIDDITKQPLNLECFIYINCTEEPFTISNLSKVGSIRNLHLEKFADEYYKQCIVNKEEKKQAPNDQLSVSALIKLKRSVSLTDLKAVIIEKDVLEKNNSAMLKI